jgi:hypothetical protein
MASSWLTKTVAGRGAESSEETTRSACSARGGEPERNRGVRRLKVVEAEARRHGARGWRTCHGV